MGRSRFARRFSICAALVALALTASSCAYYQGAIKARYAGGAGAVVVHLHRGDPRDHRTGRGHRRLVRGHPQGAAVLGRLRVPVGPVRRGQEVRRAVADRRARPRPTDGDRSPRTCRAWARTTSAAASPRRCSTAPSFDRQNPILDSVGLDDVFDPSKPEVLQYDGNGPTAKLVGFDYYVRTNTGLPPAGFPGNNDWWHHHPWICLRKTDAAMIAFNISDSACTSQGRRRQREHGELLHAPRVGARRHEVRARRVRRA